VTSRSALGARERAILIGTILRPDCDAAGAPAARRAGNTLVANGDDDTTMVTEHSRLLAQHPFNAQLRSYPDAGP
jgi:hypothetical protein